MNITVWGRGGNIFDLEMAIANDDSRATAQRVRRIVGRQLSRPTVPEPEMKWGLPGYQHEYLLQRVEEFESKHSLKHNAIYPYFRADGKFSYVKVRFIDKQNDETFRQYALSSKSACVPEIDMVENNDDQTVVLDDAHADDFDDLLGGWVDHHMELFP
jgi:hypothetical protein